MLIQKITRVYIAPPAEYSNKIHHGQKAEIHSSHRSSAADSSESESQHPGAGEI